MDAGEGAAACDLTVVIVNYNVRHFLEQCLYSVARASEGLRVQTIVVDNASADDSLAMLRARPGLEVIANAENVGFARANNQGIRRARGRYILLLNPDTLVPTAAFRRCLALADASPDIGAIGVRMVDGSGRYLPESKRGLPTPWVSFAKMSGLAALAPASARFNGYYLGHLPEHETADVDVLPGAFMWLRPEALARVGGGLDEDYFMYGEDIDLSYVIQRAGFRVVYFPAVTIVHYKGESTRKRSWRYVKAFYRAMAIFSRKHLRGGGPSPQPLLEAAIYARASVAVLANALAAAAPALVDAALLLAGLLFVKRVWAVYYFADPGYYDASGFAGVNVPIYLAAWSLGLHLAGAYVRPFRLWAALRGIGFGTVVAIVTYAFLPTEYRSSRAIPVLAAGLGLGLLGAWRLAWSAIRPADVSLTRHKLGRDRRLLIVGTDAEATAILGILARAGVARRYFGRVAPAGDGVPTDAAPESSDVLGGTGALATIAKSFAIDEVVFGLTHVDPGALTAFMARLGPHVDYRTLAPGADAIVGSPSRNTPGQAYALTEDYALGPGAARRTKRSLDVAVALALLLFAPLAWLTAAPLATLRNAVAVLLGGLTWVGYAGRGPHPVDLPRLRPGVLPQGAPDEGGGAFAKTDVQYARYWRLGDDVSELWHRRRQLGADPLALPRVAPPRWPSTWLSLRPTAGRR